jgi:hypothetical protein
MSDTKWSENLTIPQESKDAAQEYKVETPQADDRQDALLEEISSETNDAPDNQATMEAFDRQDALLEDYSSPGDSSANGSDWSENLTIPQESKDAAQEYKVEKPQTDDRQDVLLDSFDSEPEAANDQLNDIKSIEPTSETSEAEKAEPISTKEQGDQAPETSANEETEPKKSNSLEAATRGKKIHEEFAEADLKSWVADGWTKMGVNETLGDKRRPDLVLVKEPTETTKGTVLVVDYYTGSKTEIQGVGGGEARSHNQKGWEYKTCPEIAERINSGYEFRYLGVNPDHLPLQ